MRHHYMFVPLDERSRTIPISTRKLEKGFAKLIGTRGDNDNDADWHDVNDGLFVESLAHPFPVIWKAVTVFGVNTSAIPIPNKDHRRAMQLAQEIFREWERLAGGINSLKAQPGDDDRGSHAAGSKRKRDDHDDQGDEGGRDEDDEGDDNTKETDDEVRHNDDVYETGLNKCPLAIPEDAPTFVSDSDYGVDEDDSSVSEPDSRRSDVLWVGPLPIPRHSRTHSVTNDVESDESDEEDDENRPSGLMPSESSTALLDKWFKNDYKTDHNSVSLAGAGIGLYGMVPVVEKVHDATVGEVVSPSSPVNHERPPVGKRRRIAVDDV